MKVAILTLALVALVASVAYAAPSNSEEAEIEAFINKLMKKEQATKQDSDTAEIESLLAQLQEEDDEDNDGGDNELAALQELIVLEQNLSKAKAQGWRRGWRKVGRFVKRHGPTIFHVAKKFIPW